MEQLLQNIPPFSFKRLSRSSSPLCNHLSCTSHTFVLLISSCDSEHSAQAVDVFFLLQLATCFLLARDILQCVYKSAEFFHRISRSNCSLVPPGCHSQPVAFSGIIQPSPPRRTVPRSALAALVGEGVTRRPLVKCAGNTRSRYCEATINFNELELPGVVCGMATARSRILVAS